MDNTVRERKRKERRDRRKAEAILREQQMRARNRLDETRAKQEDVDVRAHNALVLGLLPRIQAAVDAWCGKRVPMSMEFPTLAFAAWTDFERIRIDIPASEVSIDFVGDLRGLAYHEAGHVRKTVPFLDLMHVVLPSEDEDEDGIVTRNDRPAWQWLQAAWGVSKSEVVHAWNILEDQRMETAMVQDSINLAAYYNVIVLSHVIKHAENLGNVWTFLIGRAHVDADVRAASRQAMLDAHGEDKVLQAETLVHAYMTATNAHDLWAPIIPYARLLQATGGGKGGEVDQHGEQRDSDYDNELDDLTDQDLDALADAIMNGAVKPGPAGEDAIPLPIPMPGDGSKGDKTEDGAKGTGQTDDDANDKADEPGDGAGNSKGSPDFMKRLGDALQRAMDRRNADKNLVHDVRSFNEAYRDARSGTPLRRLTPMPSNDADRMNQAIQVNRSLRTIFEAARAETAPSWQINQRRGVLDVVRYKTRKPGDMEFFRNYAEGGDMYLPNLAVSLVLDGSGSMSRYEADLGMAAFAVKSACDIFSIPCTVTVYDVNAWLLWDAEDRPLDMPTEFIPGGGTNPLEALDVIDRQTCDKEHHLVIIMTDGDWQGGWMGTDHGGYSRTTHSLAEYRLPDRDVVVLFWNTPVKHIRGIETVSAHGRIDKLMEIPAIVRRFILAAL